MCWKVTTSVHAKLISALWATPAAAPICHLATCVSVLSQSSLRSLIKRARARLVARPLNRLFGAMQVSLIPRVYFSVHNKKNTLHTAAALELNKLGHMHRACFFFARCAEVYLQRAQITFRRARSSSRCSWGQKGKIPAEHNCMCKANEMLDALICLRPIARTQHAYIINVTSISPSWWKMDGCVIQAHFKYTILLMTLNKRFISRVRACRSSNFRDANQL